MGAIDVFKGLGVKTDSQVTTYKVTVKIRNLLVGGVPANESVIRSWLRTRLEMDDQALEEVVKQTLAERGQSEFTSTDEALDALMEKQETVSVNGFKRDPQTGELMVEGRCVKAGLKEWANSAYPGTEWPGKTNVSKGFRKGLMATLAERAFVQEVFIGTGIKGDEVSPVPGVGPAWIEERIKHVMTPQGPKSALNRVEVIKEPTLTFTLKVHDDFLPLEAWARILERGEDIGLGADRGRSDGQFDLIGFEQIK